MSSIVEELTPNSALSTAAIEKEEEEEEEEEQDTGITTTGNNATAESTESILVVGATGLVGGKIVKQLARFVKPHQTLYVLSRSRFKPTSTPNLVNIISESAVWPSEIARIPNLTTVYSALGARGPSRFVNNQIFNMPSDEEFAAVNYNLNLQVAIASKKAGVENFVLISNYMVGHRLPNLTSRKTKIRALVEKEIAELKFKNLVIFRPGPLAGIRMKVGSAKMFSAWSLIEGLAVIAITPCFFFNITTPGSFFSFATTVAKASAAVIEQLPEAEGESRVAVCSEYDIMRLGTIYNQHLTQEILAELQRLSEMGEEQNIEDFEQLSVLLFGESLAKITEP
ncbi:hypothetical protein WICPIJ_000528 [Wickerhamomyces pijperi]|uniref:NAD-dependent epimerase/dehydratase domain-containing protein n=1 Tax=Wickerhamomyces pijperi TaxID=599730 RepID=A0A9P8TRU1_WICPI|nr:hypothetical protein WICPIJ_000528 [Wickerhamomyces pijperi]